MIILDLMHPSDQITAIMRRIYGYGMTTTSGGNLSIKDNEGNIWITPAGNDKGTRKPEDIVRIEPDGTFRGPFKPSSEYPFHLAIYRARPDVNAVLHAHPPALVCFSIMHETPDTRIIPKAKSVCGNVGFAPYALPGSAELGENIAATFSQGSDIVMLENHGVVAAGRDLFSAFERFETLDFCARLILKARILGKERSLAQDRLDLSEHKQQVLDEYDLSRHSLRELQLRKEMCTMLRRAYDHGLVTSTEGTFSCRVDEGGFLITPFGVDRMYIDASDLILIQDGRRERGRIPSRSARLHERIYRQSGSTGAILIAHPPNVMAFGVSGTVLDTRTIPETYIILGEINVIPYGPQFTALDRLAARLTEASPLLMVENDCLIVTGQNLLQAYDRLEVAEYSAKAIIAAKPAGTVRHIGEKQIRDLRRAFGKEKQGGADITTGSPALP